MSATRQLLDRDSIERAFPPAYLERGARYAGSGHVLTANLDVARAMATGRVRGSGGRAYQCIVQVAMPANGEPELIGQCSCPVGFNCKHVAAVLLVLAEREVRSSEVPEVLPDTRLPAEVRSWLYRVERLAKDNSTAETPDQLLYLIHQEHQNGIRATMVRAVKSRRLTDGGWGKARDFNILAQTTAAFVTPEDQRILALVQTRSQIRSGNLPGTKQARLDDRTGSDVMRAIVASGRAYFEQPDGPALADAGPLPGRLVWRLGQDARLHVELETDRPGLLLLALTPPWYLDPMNGNCGPLETALDDQEAGLLAMAPPVPAEAADALEQAARERIGRLRLPLPK
ncbi:MAG: SWIM zinc finger family protein, partial [Thiohalocapsa sp.]